MKWFKPIYGAGVWAATLALLLVYAILALFQYDRSSADLHAMLRREGVALLDALIAGGGRAILAYQELEVLMQSRLGLGARLVEVADAETRLSPAQLDSLAASLDLDHIQLLDGRGRSVMAGGETEMDDSEIWVENAELTPLLSGSQHGPVVLDRGEGRGGHYAVAVARRRGGAVVASSDAQRLLDFRKELGPGRLIQEIGARPGIAYVVLQDTLGILLASQSVREMGRIPGDAFLTDLLSRRDRDSRLLGQGDRQVFEIAGCLVLGDEALGLFRIGMDTGHIRELLAVVRLRLTAIGFLLGVAAAIGLSAYASRQRVKLLSQAYVQVKTHTGEILQSLADAVVAVDGAGKVTVFNQAAAALLGISATQATGRPLTDFDLPVLLLLSETLSTGRPQERPLEEVLLSDERKILSLKTSLVRDDSGQVESAIWVATDLTAQHRLEQALRQQEKLGAMGRLASGVAHEVRNPINAIGMIAQRLRKEFHPTEDEDEYQSLARTLVEETRRSDAIIQRFLRFARPPKLHPRPVAMAPFLKETAGVLESSFKAKGAVLSVGVADDAVLSIDPDQMKQALLNLLQNSLDAVPPGGRAGLSGRVEAGEYVIVVSDDGGGIAPADLSSIFDLYFTTKDEGLGMGLPQVQQVAQRHGGRIEVQSEPGRETRFTIHLPLEGRP